MKIPITDVYFETETRVKGVRGYGGTTTGLNAKQGKKLQYDTGARMLEFHRPDNGLTLIPAERVSSMDVDMQLLADLEAGKPEDKPVKK
jgi:hypothetical protein